MQFLRAAHQGVHAGFGLLPAGTGLRDGNRQDGDRIFQDRQGTGGHVSGFAAAAAIPGADLHTGRRDLAQGAIAKHDRRPLSGGRQADCRAKIDAPFRAVDDVHPAVGARLAKIFHFTPLAIAFAVLLDDFGGLDLLVRLGLDRDQQVELVPNRSDEGRVGEQQVVARQPGADPGQFGVDLGAVMRADLDFGLAGGDHRQAVGGKYRRRTLAPGWETVTPCRGISSAWAAGWLNVKRSSPPAALGGCRRVPIRFKNSM